MINATVIFDGEQCSIHLPDHPSLDSIYQYFQEYFSRRCDFRKHIIQLFDPMIGEFFDLNDDGLKAWKALPMKERNHMRFQIIRAGIDTQQSNGHGSHSTEHMSDVFQKIQRDIELLFGAIESK